MSPYSYFLGWNIYKILSPHMIAYARGHLHRNFVLFSDSWGGYWVRCTWMSDNDRYPIVWRTYLRYLFHSFMVGFNLRSFTVRFVPAWGLARRRVRHFHSFVVGFDLRWISFTIRFLLTRGLTRVG